MQCNHCGDVFTPKQRTQRYCSQICKSRAAKKRLVEKNPDYWADYYQANKETLRSSKDEWAARNADRVKRYDYERYHANAGEKSAKAKLEYATRTSPTARKVLDLAERMTVPQKSRFADWLLRTHHVTLRVWSVDDFVATYNTEGI